MIVHPAKTQIRLGGSDQTVHPPSLIRVFAVRSVGSKGPKLLSYLADAQADLSLRWAHMPFCWFYHVVAHTDLVQTWNINFVKSYNGLNCGQSTTEINTFLF